jgi:hypothetical protein
MSKGCFSTTPQERYLEDYVEKAFMNLGLLRSRRKRSNSSEKILIRSFFTRIRKGQGKRIITVLSQAVGIPAVYSCGYLLNIIWPGRPV